MHWPQEEVGDITFLIPTKVYLTAGRKRSHSRIIVWLNAYSSSITAPTCCDLFTQKELFMSERLLTLTQVQDQTGFRKSKLYELIVAKEFPEPIHFGRAVRWLESEVQLWIRQQIKTHRSSWTDHFSLSLGVSSNSQEVLLGNGRKSVSVSASLTEADLTPPILCKVNVDTEFEQIYAGTDSGSDPFLSFTQRLDLFAEHYALDIKIPSPVWTNCSSCEFYTKDGEEESGLLSG